MYLLVCVLLTTVVKIYPSREYKRVPFQRKVSKTPRNNLNPSVLGGVEQWLHVNREMKKHPVKRNPARGVSKTGARWGRL